MLFLFFVFVKPRGNTNVNINSLFKCRRTKKDIYVCMNTNAEREYSLKYYSCNLNSFK